ncbi:hypothetical protein LguiA_004267 [Lonicera macranthoides]
MARPSVRDWLPALGFCILFAYISIRYLQKLEEFEANLRDVINILEKIVHEK